MIRKTINWKKVWDEFGTWFMEESTKRNTCTKCNNIESCSPDWEEQERKIQKLVNIEVRKLTKK